MTACETCWGDAYARTRMLGGTQVENYRALLRERAIDHADICQFCRCGHSIDDHVTTHAETACNVCDCNQFQQVG